MDHLLWSCPGLQEEASSGVRLQHPGYYGDPEMAWPASSAHEPVRTWHQVVKKGNTGSPMRPSGAPGPVKEPKSQTDFAKQGRRAAAIPTFRPGLPLFTTPLFACVLLQPVPEGRRLELPGANSKRPRFL